MKHLLLLTPGFAADENDSRCIPPLQLYARKLQERGLFKITILALNYPYRCEQFDWHGISVYACHKKGALQKVRVWKQAFSWLKKINREDPIDGVHSFWLHDVALLGHYFGAYLKVPHWTTMMGQDVRPANKYLRFLPLKKMQLIALTEFHAQQFKQTTGLAAQHLIPWGLDPSNFKFDIMPPKRFDIIGVGNLIELKNYALFIRLLARLRKQFPKLKAALIGDGPQRKALEEQANTNGLKDHLDFLGYVQREEVLKHMGASRIFLHTSTFESFGYVLLEAMASGQTVISTPVGMAMSSDFCHTGKNEEELFEQLFKHLSATEKRNPSFPHLIEDTLKSYLTIYNNSL